MQAARGASLNDPAEEPASPVGPAGTVSRVPLLLAVAATVLALDVGSKALAVAELTDREPISLLGGLLTLRVVRNPGAAFGMAKGLTILFTLVALAVVVVILRLARRLQSARWAAALGLVLGGALGNLLDRLLRSPGPGRGHVVDFLELPRWPVFNLADSAIVIAALLMVGLTARGVPHGAERVEPGQNAADSDSDRGRRKPE